MDCSVAHPVRNDDELYFMADVPHLVKNLRAAFAKHRVYLPGYIVEREKLPSNVASIGHLKALLKYQEPLMVKLCPFLKEQDLDCTHFVKMVGFWTQFLETCLILFDFFSLSYLVELS